MDQGELLGCRRQTSFERGFSRRCWKRAWRLEMVETRVSTPRYRLRMPRPTARRHSPLGYRTRVGLHCAVAPKPLCLRRVGARRARVVRPAHHVSGAVVTCTGSWRAAWYRCGRRARASGEREHCYEYDQRHSGHPQTCVSHVLTSPCTQRSRAAGPYPAYLRLDGRPTIAFNLAGRALHAEVPAPSRFSDHTGHSLHRQPWAVTSHSVRSREQYSCSSFLLMQPSCVGQPGHRHRPEFLSLSSTIIVRLPEDGGPTRCVWSDAPPRNARGSPTVCPIGSRTTLDTAETDSGAPFAGTY